MAFAAQGGREQSYVMVFWAMVISPLRQLRVPGTRVSFSCILLFACTWRWLRWSLFCTDSYNWVIVWYSDLEFSRLESWSRDPFLQVLVSVLVLEPSSLGLGLGTSESWSWSWNPRVSVSVLGLATIKSRFSSLMKREIVRVPPLLLWNGYLAAVVCWCGLEQG